MIRKATMADVSEIHRLITYHAERDRMLFRSHADLYEHLRDFVVYVEPGNEAGRVVGCVALELVWRDLAEIKSLAVDDGHQSRGIGRKLVEAACDEGDQLALGKIFVLTREEAFFTKMGFGEVPKEMLPHKVWSDCVRCPHREDCDETAMILELKGDSDRRRVD